MTTQTRFRVVVGYDFSSQATLAIDRAIWLSQGFEAAELHVVSATKGNRTNPDFPADVAGDALRAILKDEVEHRLAAVRPPSVLSFIHVRPEPGADAVLGVANEIRADLIIVGTHSKKGLAKVVLGSVSQAVVAQARCSVLIEREQDYQTVEATIEPPCARCLNTRRETEGKQWWCEFHDHAPPYASPLRSHHQVDPERARRLAWPMY